MFNQFQKEVFDESLVIGDKPNYEIGAKYAYVLSQTFSSISPATASYVDLKGKYRSKFTSFVNKFTNPKYIEHLNRITFVENMDFQVVIEKYDSLSTFYYLDPPYKNREEKYSNHNFVSETHERLMNVLKTTKGKWALSYYDFPELHGWYPENEYTWVTKDFKKASGASKGKLQSTGTELLIMNYEL
jgi:DNA adenine methylase